MTEQPPSTSPNRCNPYLCDKYLNHAREISAKQLEELLSLHIKNCRLGALFVALASLAPEIISSIQTLVQQISNPDLLLPQNDSPVTLFREKMSQILHNELNFGGSEGKIKMLSFFNVYLSSFLGLKVCCSFDYCCTELNSSLLDLFRL